MRRSKNPWDAIDPTDLRNQGQAIISIGLHAGEHIRFSRPQVANLVGSIADATILFSVGTTRGWGKEPSARVVLLNASIERAGRPVLSWRAFVSHARLIAQRLCETLAQEVVVLETLSSTGAYQITPYRNSPTLLKNQRRRILARRSGHIVNPRRGR
jgi:hypothetical protein